MELSSAWLSLQADMCSPGEPEQAVHVRVCVCVCVCVFVCALKPATIHVRLMIGSHARHMIASSHVSSWEVFSLERESLTYSMIMHCLKPSAYMYICVCVCVCVCVCMCVSHL